VQHLIRICQRGLAMRTGRRLGAYRFVGMTGQRAATAFAAQAAVAWSTMLGLFRLVRLLTLRRRQARVGRSFPRLAEPRFKFSNPLLGRLKTPPECPDQSVLLGVAQAVEVGKLRHALG